MPLSVAQRTLFNRAVQLGSGRQAVGLNEGACRALLGITARDLAIVPEVATWSDGLNLFDGEPPSRLEVEGGMAAIDAFERLVDASLDADQYFACLAALHKGRLKYERILATQPLPTMDQVGPRGLLLYGLMPPADLAALLLWRKWIFDIDNRAGQETGYLFEPILAAAVGGAPASATKSPVRRRNNPAKGRQVDCLLGKVAYEFKLRVTIAASGQGRWGEELDFPKDCVASGFTPALVVLDPTDDPKLTQLVEAFRSAGGHAYVGDDAWEHLEEQAGPRMAVFVERYIRQPLAELLAHSPNAEDLSPLSVEMRTESVRFSISDATVVFRRDEPDPDLATDQDEIPEDAADQLPGL